MQDFEMTIYIKADPIAVWEAITGDEGSRAVMFGSVLVSDLAIGWSTGTSGRARTASRPCTSTERCSPWSREWP